MEQGIAVYLLVLAIYSESQSVATPEPHFLPNWVYSYWNEATPVSISWSQKWPDYREYSGPLLIQTPLIRTPILMIFMAILRCIK